MKGITTPGKPCHFVAGLWQNEVTGITGIYQSGNTVPCSLVGFVSSVV